ncbi:hypothetical protein EPN52_09030 [bacterium]|nr:MAG: hypothetical protein EPN52_09030 [bacterium]
MARIKYPQVLVGAVLLVTGLYFWWLSTGLQLSAAEYPRIVLALMIGVAAIMVGAGIRYDRSVASYDFAGVAVPIVLTLIYIALFGRLDFRVLTALYVLAMIWKHPAGWSRFSKVVLAAATSMALYTIFVRAFNLPIP